MPKSSRAKRPNPIAQTPAAPKNPKRVDELLGVDTRSIMSAAEWEALLVAGKCPFAAGRCTKTRKGDVSSIIGTCTLEYNNTPTIICPNRLLQRNKDDNHIQLFKDAADLVGIPFEDVKYVSEVRIPGGNVDFVLYEKSRGSLTNFVGIEIQTLDTTGSAWPNREIFLKSVGVTSHVLLSPVATSDQLKKQYGMNWKMTAKTILIQMIHKVETFDHLDGKLILAIQSPLWKILVKDFNFESISTKGHDKNDTMHFFVYELSDLGEGSGYELGKLQKFSTDVKGLWNALNLKTSQNVSIEDMCTSVKRRPEKTLDDTPAPLAAAEGASIDGTNQEM